MGTLNEDLSAIKEVEDKIVANKVARFAYTDEAYTTNDANGVAEYNVNNDQNIPTADASVLKVNETVLSKGYRAQASSVTRMLLNHFFGRMSYNLNKVNDIVSNLIATLIGHRGTANGFATLDENGRIPYSQLPESVMEYKGQWNAETNTPTLADGTGTKGDFYIVSVSGTQNLGSGNIQFSENDRIIYDGSVWSRLSAGGVKTVNSVLPTNGNVALTGENIPVSATNATLLSAPLTTDRYADRSVTNAKIADNAVTNAKIADNAVTNAKIKDPISVAKGGTGKTTPKGAQNALLSDMQTETTAMDDSTEFVMKYEAPTDTKGALFKRSATLVWDYIKDKISSVLGLTASDYSGRAHIATNADYSKNMYQQIFDLTSLDKTKFYPLVCPPSHNFAEVAIFSEGGDDTIEFNQNRIHFYISTTGWSDTPFTLNIREYACYENNEITIGCIGRGTSFGSWALWLRGGIRYICQSRSCDLSLHTSDYTYGDETYTVGTNYYGGANSNVNVVFTPQSTITNGAYINRAITAPVIQAETFIGNVSGNSNSGMVHTCQTASATREKTVSIPGFTLTQGACIRVAFTNGNSVTNPTLNVNGTGAKVILSIFGSLNTIITSASDLTVKQGYGVCSWGTFVVLDLYYDGSYWKVIGDPIVETFYDNTAQLRKSISIIGNVQSSILR